MKKFGFLFDIDGVLLRHKELIPHTKDIFRYLQSKQYPYALLSNSGGFTEKERIVQLREIFGKSFSISSEELILSHSPIRSKIIEPNYPGLINDHVLVIGLGNTIGVAKESVGLNRAIHSDQYVLSRWEIYPQYKEYLERSGIVDCGENDDDLESVSLKAVFVLHDSLFMQRDIQVVMDVIFSRTGIPGKNMDYSRQHVPLIMSNPDFLYGSDFPAPRFGQGLFRMCLQETFKRLCTDSTQSLSIIQCGKPTNITFQYARDVLQRKEKLDDIFMIGDNPDADILGANRNQMRSVLVQTGVATNNEPQHDDLRAEFFFPTAWDFFEHFDKHLDTI